MPICKHRVFFRRISKGHKKSSNEIKYQAFKLRPGEDGLSVYLSDIITPLEALAGECEVSGRHLGAFRDCSCDLSLDFIQDDDDPAHWLVLPPNDSDKQLEWCVILANITSLKLECLSTGEIKEFDDPEIDCHHTDR